MVKKLLLASFLKLIPFFVSVQMNTYTGTTGENRNIGRNWFLKLVLLFTVRRFTVYAKRMAFVLFLFFFISLANAATIKSSTTGGTWATGSTWVGGIAPASGDTVIIATVGAGRVTLGANASIVNVTIDIGATLDIVNKTVVITDGFTNNGTLTGTTGIVALTGNFTNSGNFSLSTGRLTIAAGNFINTGIFTFTGAGRLLLGGDYTNLGTVSLMSSLVQFTGTVNQSIQGFTTTGTISMLKTGGIATFTGNVSGGGLTINGTGGALVLGTGLIHTFTGTWTRTAGTLNGGSSLLKIGGSISGTGGTFTASTGTVVYNKAGTQTGGVVTYNNLTLSGTSIKTFATTPIVNGTLSLEGTATIVVTTGVVTYGANATLQYNTVTPRTTTLEEWITPFVATGGVIIANTGTITINAAKIFNTSIPLTINSGSKLASNNLGLTFGGNFINNGGTFTAGSSPIVISYTMGMQSIAGFVTTGLVSMTKTAGTATFLANIGGAGLIVNGTGGALHLGTGLTHTFTGNITLTSGTLSGGSSVMNVNATSALAWNGTGTNFSCDSGTVNFGGVAQTLATASSFNNLTFSNSGVKTLTGVPTVSGILSMEGTTTVSAAPIYGASAMLQYNRTLPVVSGPEWIIPFAATGGISIINTGIITLNEAKFFNVSVPLTIASVATLDNGGFAVSGGSTLSVNNGGTLRLSGTSAFPSSFTTTTLDTTSAVNYNGDGQTVAAKNYGNLTLSGSGNKTFAAATTIAGDLAISGAAIALFPDGSASTSGVLTLGGTLQTVLGSWGGNISAATNKNATWFGSTTTGVLNVITTCMAGTWLGVLSTDWNTAGNWCGGTLPTADSNITIAPATNQPIIGVSGGVCRNIIIDSGATLTLSGSNTLAVSGNWSNNGVFTANSSTINFNGVTAQSIGGTSTNIFNNLTNSNTSATVTAQGDITVNNVLMISDAVSVLDMSTFTLSGGIFFLNSGTGQIRTSNDSVVPLPFNKTWTCTVIYDHLTGGQTIVGGTYNGYPSLELNNTSGVQTASGNISIGGRLNIENGGIPTFTMSGFNLTAAILNMSNGDAILDMSSGVLTYASVAAMDGKVRFSGISNGKAFASGTVEYYGSAQTVAIGTYYNLLFSGVSGNWTITGYSNVAKALTVTNGALNVLGDASIAVGDAVTVTAPGTLTLQNNASLIQTNYAGSNTGDIIVKRYTTPLLLDDFTYWSSPTTGVQTLLNFSSNTQSNKYFGYDNDWGNIDAATTVFEQGIGYAIRSPEGTSTSIPTVDTSFQFAGVPNNGTINIPVTVRTSGPYIGTGERLVGNPYPSALDADDFIDANITTGTGTQTISGTLYFWSHNHRIAGNNYDAIDYATYTKAGGVGVPSGTGNMIAPTRYIASGQGFFVMVEAEGDVTFDNSMRDINNTNTNFYKSVSTSKKQNGLDENNRIWLNLTNNTPDGSQILVGYIANATTDFDPGYDGLVYNDTQSFALYSLLGKDKLAIQARSLSFVATDTVPLGYAINVAGNATITLDHMDGVFLEDQNIYIEDKLLHVVHNIKTAPYNFTSAAGTFNDRFVLRYTDITLGNTDFETQENTVLISNKNKQIVINSSNEAVNKVQIYDLSGRLIYQKMNVNTNELTISDLAPNNQILLVKIILQNGAMVTKKITN